MDKTKNIWLVTIISTDNFTWDNVDVETFPCETKETAIKLFNDNSNTIAEDFNDVDKEFLHVKKSDVCHEYIDTFSGKYCEVKMTISAIF